MKYFTLTIFLISINYLQADCSDLDYADCLYWSEYCEWNEDSNECQEIGGGDGGGTDWGPYEYLTLTESDGLRDGPDYNYAVLYYPIADSTTDLNLPYKSIIMSPGWGDDGSGMDYWGEFFASYGFVSMIIGPNDPINDDHQDRGLGLVDAMETIRQENDRTSSPLFGLVDLEAFAVGGHSMGGGAAQAAAMLDPSIKAIISLNPTFFVYDTENCDGPEYYCLIPEHLNHPVPALIFPGEIEIDEMGADYNCCLGQTIYDFIPETTEKILFEVSGEGHDAAAYPSEEIADYILNWLNYQLNNDNSYCELLLELPSNASQYLTNIICSSFDFYDINGDGVTNNSDFTQLLVSLLNQTPLELSGDLNFDSSVDIYDLLILSDYLDNM